MSSTSHTQSRPNNQWTRLRDDTRPSPAQYEPPAKRANLAADRPSSKLWEDENSRSPPHGSHAPSLLVPHPRHSAPLSPEDCDPSDLRYKTEVCRNFKERSKCVYGEQCQFAHGRRELRDVVRNAKYKTKHCQKYWITGYCAYGPRCNFLHNEQEGTPSQETRCGSKAARGGGGSHWGGHKSARGYASQRPAY
ncbi:hypothetical protein TCAL_03104 [Tigriopus californicus]|uniref:C3H1-type domain-containing protein n=1 Tax=Tigriopus californicus TaxID=6832 RepID=A0A553NNV1_TIGCA|nr:hypothetical protein TCAL_03104 [Tigriopus californicus]|eukprot:TCALIF_03104-PA protein Name:"Similar to zfp36l2-A Zinc finger protein 36, C3H1 type-like 2-A (Xenopus laevis)" AED:0.00 eAED:0.00 QI:237/1/1/1/0/0/2/10/192